MRRGRKSRHNREVSLSALTFSSNYFLSLCIHAVPLHFPLSCNTLHLFLPFRWKHTWHWARFCSLILVLFLRSSRITSNKHSTLATYTQIQSTVCVKISVCLQFLNIPFHSFSSSFMSRGCQFVHLQVSVFIWLPAFHSAPLSLALPFPLFNRSHPKALYRVLGPASSYMYGQMSGMGWWFPMADHGPLINWARYWEFLSCK